MKNLLILALALTISTSATAGLTDLYNAIDTNKTASTKVDNKAAEIKNKLDSKLGKIAEKATKAEEESTAQQEKLKSKLEAKLAELVSEGKGSSDKANEIKAEIESLKKLIEAAQK